MSGGFRACWVVAIMLGVVAANGTAVAAATKCDRLLAELAHQIADATCVDSKNLTTNNASTTPPDNSLVTVPPLPNFAFPPRTDRSVISPNPPNRTPIGKAVPGIQLDGRVAGDP